MKLTLVIALFGVCSAWWCTGHMLVAHIAQQQLLQSNPAIYNFAQSILAPLNGPLTHNIANTFTETACWPDDLKTYAFDEANSLHFIDKPYNPQGMSTPPVPSDNIVWAISNFNYTLTAPVIAPLEKSVALRFLIHFFGDIHQPLHCTTLFDEQFPNSDIGGNSFKIVYDQDVNELHALWDSAIGMLEQDLPRPLSDSNWAYMNQLAEWYTANYTRTDLELELQASNVTTWTIESFMLAKDYAYYGIKVGDTPSPQYIAEARQIVMKQIALGGYRLADFLISALTPMIQVEHNY